MLRYHAITEARRSEHMTLLHMLAHNTATTCEAFILRCSVVASGQSLRTEHSVSLFSSPAADYREIR